MDSSILLKSVRYFDTGGNQIRSFINKPLRLGPLATREFLVERDDATGGSGANFLVEWVADKPVSEPIIESVMIDTSGQQGISFVRAGTVIKELIAPPRDEPAANGGAE